MNNKKIKVGIFVDSFYPNIDGVTQVVNNYCYYLNKYDDVDVTLVTPRYKNGNYDQYEFKVYPYFSWSAGKRIGYRVGWPYFRKIIKDVREMDFDIIHIHSPMASSELVRITYNLGHIDHTKIILTYHTKLDVDFEARVKFPPLKKAAYAFLKGNVNRTDEVWIVSEGSESALRRVGYKGKCRVMENGVDLSKGKASKEKCAALKKKYNIPENAVVFSFVGRMQWYKNIRLILDALKLVKKAGLDYRFLLVGDGFDLKEMLSYAKELGIDDKVISTGSIRDREELRVFYSITDLFLFLSTFDTAAIVVKEAAACECPCLFAQGSDSAYGVKDGVNGYFSKENPNCLADKILDICKDREALKQVGVKAGETLYVPWEESVHNAYLRYKEILNEK